jgi:hypothetical protein
MISGQIFVGIFFEFFRFAFNLRTDRMKEEDLMYKEINTLVLDLIKEYASCVRSSFLNRISMGESPNNSIGYYLLETNNPEATKLNIQRLFFGNSKFNRFFEQRKQKKIFGYVCKICNIIENTKSDIAKSEDIPKDVFDEMHTLLSKIQ